MKKRRKMFRSKKGLSKRELFYLALGYVATIRRAVRKYRAAMMVNITSNNALYKRLIHGGTINDDH